QLGTMGVLGTTGMVGGLGSPEGMDLVGVGVAIGGHLEKVGVGEGRTTVGLPVVPPHAVMLSAVSSARSAPMSHQRRRAGGGCWMMYGAMGAVRKTCPTPIPYCQVPYCQACRPAMHWWRPALAAHTRPGTMGHAR